MFTKRTNSSYFKEVTKTNCFHATLTDKNYKENTACIKSIPVYISKTSLKPISITHLS